MWSKIHPEAIRMLEDSAPTYVSVEQFKALLCKRFLLKAVKLPPIFFDVEIQELGQKEDKFFALYYKKVTNLMTRVGAKDRLVLPNSTPLSLPELAMLDIIV